MNKWTEPTCFSSKNQVDISPDDKKTVFVVVFLKKSVKNSEIMEFKAPKTRFSHLFYIQSKIGVELWKDRQKTFFYGSEHPPRICKKKPKSPKKRPKISDFQGSIRIIYSYWGTQFILIHRSPCTWLYIATNRWQLTNTFST